MNTFRHKLTRSGRLAAVVASASWVIAAGRCAEDVGQTRTTKTETVRTPEGTTTVTETHEKNTTLTPR